MSSHPAPEAPSLAPHASRHRAAALEAMSRLVVDVPDYPQPGVVFKDITPLLADHDGFHAAILALAESGRDESGTVVVDKVLGMEARGFILAAPVALDLEAGFVPVRKAGKLPRACLSESYALEYGTATLEMHVDAVQPGDRVLLVDDVLATGGTIAATRRLVADAGGVVVGAAVLMELGFLQGRRVLDDVPCTALMEI
ncbi:adenine phosphoribosyltransferase [Nocardioides sp. Y6]|uniref:Adenine phosphoribosyltransferase n=2 Tax=Nocardioides malaquae TaxID=2773426 RepID=A0ABR9RRX4_9ACTN|nr:adenine phosphoribosyltransferase [Nocardioides malaquae]